MAEQPPEAVWRHDIKNQLGIVLGFTELLLEDLAPESPIRADLEEVLKAGRRAMSLVEDIEPKR